MNAKKPEQILRSTVASFAELRRHNAQEEERRLRILRQRADSTPRIVRPDKVITVPVAKSLSVSMADVVATVVEYRGEPVSIPTVTLASIRPGYGIQGK